jgi:hypothetical protein
MLGDQYLNWASEVRVAPTATAHLMLAQPLPQSYLAELGHLAISLEAELRRRISDGAGEI